MPIERTDKANRRRSQSPTRNPFRFCKDSEEYKTWEAGYKYSLYNETPNNPHKCPIIPVENQKLAKIWNEGFLALKNDSKIIPAGIYCYEKKVCPYWTVRRSYHNIQEMRQSCGYCRLLKQGDFMDNGTMLIWDQVKECGINPDFPEESET